MQARIEKRTPVVKGSKGKPWCLILQTPTMAAPGFYYYATKREATEARDRAVKAHKPEPTFADRVLADVSSAIELLYNLDVCFARGFTGVASCDNDKALAGLRGQVRKALDALSDHAVLPHIGTLRAIDGGAR